MICCKIHLSLLRCMESEWVWLLVLPGRGQLSWLWPKTDLVWPYQSFRATQPTPADWLAWGHCCVSLLLSLLRLLRLSLPSTASSPIPSVLLVQNLRALCVYRSAPPSGHFYFVLAQPSCLAVQEHTLTVTHTPTHSQGSVGDQIF